MMWIAVRTRSSIRQVSQFKSRRLDASQIWKLRPSDQPSGRPFPRSGHTKLLHGNSLQRKCDRPNDRASSSGRNSEIGKNFSEILGQLITKLSVRTAPNFYQARRSFELSAYKLRSLGLRTARIQHWIPLVLRELYCEIIELSWSLWSCCCVCCSCA